MENQQKQWFIGHVLINENDRENIRSQAKDFECFFHFQGCFDNVCKIEKNSKSLFTLKNIIFSKTLR